MSTPTVTLLRDALKASKPVELVPKDASINEATDLSIDGQKYGLDTDSGFASEETGKSVTVRAIYEAWLHHDSNTADYLADCESNNVEVINFMERTELNSYLSAASETCKYVETKKGQKRVRIETDDTNKENKRQDLIDADPLLQEILKNERETVDHNKALRGSKLTDFSNVAKEAEDNIIKVSKSKQKQKHSAKTTETKSLATILRKKDPIIILSPSASALINMSNVKAFLEKGQFEEPSSTMGGPDMMYITRQSKQFDRNVKFVVVSNVSKFFTKPEHWDRVVAVFTTGQEWQFKNYRDFEPLTLFQKVKGYFVHYSGDPVPENVNSWNLEVVPIERTRRFKDRQTSEALWESLEKFMAARGYK